MAYFSNGTEGEVYRDHYCSKCVHDQEHNCSVWLAHLLYNYSFQEKSMLDLLIPRSKNGLGNEKCTMFIPLHHNALREPHADNKTTETQK